MNRKQMIAHLTLHGWEGLRTPFWAGVKNDDWVVYYYHTGAAGTAADSELAHIRSSKVRHHYSGAYNFSYENINNNDLKRLVTYIKNKKL